MPYNNASNYLIGGNDEHGVNPPTAGKRTPIMPYLNRPFYENEFNRGAKYFFLEACVRVGFRVYDVKPELTDVSISERVTRIKRQNLSALVTYAYNAFGTGQSFNQVSGFEVYYSVKNPYVERSKVLSQLIFDELSQALETRARQVGTLDIGVLSSVNCVSSLIEAGYMTNFEDAKIMVDPDFQREVAEATCKAVCRFFNVQYTAPTNGENMPTLRLGDRGNNVRFLQYRLYNEGYNPGGFDGVFGPNTQNAVKQLQADLNLAADGIVGRQTWTKLMDFNKSQPLSKKGARNKYVRYMQQKLTSKLYNVGTIDGRFGSGTENAVKQFQYENGLAPDGIVGRQTWNKIFPIGGGREQP